MADISSTTTRNWVLGTIVVFALLSIVMFVLASIRGEQDVDPNAIEEQAALAYERALVPDSASAAGPALQVVESRYEPATRTIEGSIANATNFSYVNVQVGYDLISSAEVVVGQARDTTSSIGPGETWIFRIVVPEGPEVTSIRLASLSGGRMDSNAPGSTLDPKRPGRVAEPIDQNAAEGAEYGQDIPD